MSMREHFAVCAAQLNPVMGDIAGNLKRARAARLTASNAGADLILFSELFICGYPPEDLVLKPAFQKACRDAIEALAVDTKDGGPAILIGTPWVEQDRLHNAVAFLDEGKVQALTYKHTLPNYGVFDEKRVFQSGPLAGPFVVRGLRVGVPICEDIWVSDSVECLTETGAEILLVPNGSPYDRHKRDVRLNVAVARVVESGLPLLYLNQVGGQDELVFDGGSFVLNADRSLPVQLPSFEEAVVLTHWSRTDGGWVCAPGPNVAAPDDSHSLYLAMMLGLRDYVEKNRFPSVVLGLSGGIDSAISAAVAVDALGPTRVRCVMMPSKFTSRDSLEDAEAVAKALCVKLESVSIESSVGVLTDALKDVFAGKAADTTEENMQSRARGLILMAISNKFGPMVLTTGNKSEMSVGYATLYGDMCGGYNVLKDLYKTDVFALSRWRNANKPAGAKGPKANVMPLRVIEKPPTAELRDNQKDEDSLPPYAMLDEILVGLVEKEESVDALVAKGYDRAIVKRIEHLLYIAEYKRRQAPPGVKLSARSFGRDRRYPITNSYRDA